MKRINSIDGLFHGESTPGAGDATPFTPAWCNDAQESIIALEEAGAGGAGGTGPDALRVVAVAAGETLTIDPVATPAVKIAVNGACTLVFNFPVSAAGKSARFDLAISNPAGHAITWPASCLWSGAAKPVLATTGVNHIRGRTFDNGATWLMSYDLALRNSPVMAKPDLPYDPYWDATTLLLRMEGMEATQVVVDDRAFREPVFTAHVGSSMLIDMGLNYPQASYPDVFRNGFALMLTGDTAQNGTGDGDIWKYSVADSQAIADFGVGDFTIECRYSAGGGRAWNEVLLDRWLGNVGWQVGVYNGRPSIKIDANRYSAPEAIFNDVMVSHHLAFVRRSGVLAIFVGGVIVFSVANTTNLSSTTLPLTLGGTASAKSPPYAIVDNLRITKLARYTDPFTPPTSLPTMGLV